MKPIEEQASRAPPRHGLWSRLWLRYVMQPSNWHWPLVLVFVLGAAGMIFVGHATYTDAPPMADFVGPGGETVFSRTQVVGGQVAFLQHGLMAYGSLFGDGAGRGPDFSAEALHQVALTMEAHYVRQAGGGTAEQDAARVRMQREIKRNGYDAQSGQIRVSDGQAHAAQQLRAYYRQKFRLEAVDLIPRLGRLSDEEIDALTAFFFWSAWVCGAERDNLGYSYTHNWPHDPLAGNLPGASIVLWSVLAILCLMLALGVVLFLYGRFGEFAGWTARTTAPAPATLAQVQRFVPTTLQRATYKFFLAAGLLVVLQVLGGVLTVHNFLGLHRLFGVNLSEWLPLPAVRAAHLQLALLWVTACWVGGSIFLVSTLTPQAPRHQLALVNTLFIAFVAVVIGDLTGLLLGPQGVFGAYWNRLGNQGWEFVEIGRVWQYGLMGVLALWFVALLRAVQPVWRRYRAWFLPKWLVYCVGCVTLLFCASFVATPETNFVIADFWRWAVVHMWVEAFFEVFATIVLAYCMYLMGFIGHPAASRIVYLATLLFLGSGLLGISHNFYWNAKPVATLAIGGVFSTLQVVPLILVALEAWQFRRLPAEVLARQGIATRQVPQQFGQAAAFAFLLAVNFWNFLGAGAMGFIINLPIVNYYEHGTYLTVNHAHAAFFGVYGNLALAILFFCVRYLVEDRRWNTRLIVGALISLNLGLLMMCLLDLFPAGIHQLDAAMERGLWYARSEAFIGGSTFQVLTWARVAGGLIFALGGVLPVAYFLITRMSSPRREPDRPLEQPSADGVV
ncbi:MAG: cbb3-type cytochrome c oxidase subunit I [Sinimarinibacterium sp.]